MSGDLDLLQAALAAEHAAIYGYGLLGAHLHGAQLQTATALWEAHRSRRDRLAALVTGLGGTPVAAQPAYKLPVQVTSVRTAVQLAASLEQTVLNGYVGLAGAAAASLRSLAAQAMQDAVARQIRWSGTLPTTAFPGLGQTAFPSTFPSTSTE
jgi:hypothetical protein